MKPGRVREREEGTTISCWRRGRGAPSGSGGLSMRAYLVNRTALREQDPITFMQAGALKAKKRLKFDLQGKEKVYYLIERKKTLPRSPPFQRKETRIMEGRRQS